MQELVRKQSPQRRAVQQRVHPGIRMKTTLRYGRRGLEVALDDDITVFRTREMPVLRDPAARLRERLAEPTGSPPLCELASGRQNACIVVSDITRPVPNQILLPPIIETLEGAGIPSGSIRLLVATGIHRAPTDAELIEILGGEIAARYEIISHDARKASSVVRIGRTSRGTPMEINRVYMESDLRLVVGLVEPHFMAGYSGGRKAVSVGLTSVESIKHLHGTKFLENPGAGNCELEANPLHAELTEIALAAGVDFCVSAVIDADRSVGGVFCGDLVGSHAEACDFAGRYCLAQTEESFDVVLTTGGGYPLDTTYYQAVKGLVGALGVLSPGGGIILAAECSDGLGSGEFRSVLEDLREIGDYNMFLERISEPDNFVIDQWEAEMLVKALRRAKIFLYSTGIPECDRHLTFAESIGSIEEGLSLAAGARGNTRRMAVIPEGPYVVPMNDGIIKEPPRALRTAL